jgi:hypothetical protein
MAGSGYREGRWSGAAVAFLVLLVVHSVEERPFRAALTTINARL